MYGDYQNSDVLSKYIDMKKVIEGGIYYIHTSSSANKVLGIPDNNTQENISPRLMNSNTEHSRKFSIIYKGSGCYELAFLHSGHALADQSSAVKSDANGTPTQKKWTGSSLELWRITCLKSGGFRITNVKTKRHLSIGSRIAAGKTAYTSVKQEKTGQFWNFKKTSRSMLKLDHCVAPDTLKKKSPFIFSGTISSNYTIQKVTVSIVNKAGKTVAAASAAPKAKSYSIKKLSDKISFGKLKTGTYFFRITAVDSAKQGKTLINKIFHVKSK